MRVIAGDCCRGFGRVVVRGCGVFAIMPIDAAE